MKIYINSTNKFNPEGIPPKNLIQQFCKKYAYDVDDYYGYMFLIPASDMESAIKFADKYGFGLYSDPDNADWYYLQIID